MPATEPTITTRDGSSAVEFLVSKGTALSLVSQLCSRGVKVIKYSRIRLKRLRTFKSRTFVEDQSGDSVNGPPHVAPAFATRMSKPVSICLIFCNNRSISDVLLISAGIAMIEQAVPARDRSSDTAFSNPSSPSYFRAVKKTARAPPRTSAVAAWRPSPREPKRETVSARCYFGQRTH